MIIVTNSEILYTGKILNSILEENLEFTKIIFLKKRKRKRACVIKTDDKRNRENLQTSRWVIDFIKFHSANNLTFWCPRLGWAKKTCKMPQPVRIQCPFKCHSYLNKPYAFRCMFVSISVKRRVRISHQNL